MARLNQLALLLVCVTSALCDDAPTGTGMVQKSGQVKQKDGSVSRLTKLSDVDCHLEQDTTTDQDGAVSTIIIDYDKGKSVLLKSQAPDVCYVRDIPQDEMQAQEEHCEDGQTPLKPGSLREERVYREGGEVTQDVLSQDLAEPCKGRRLVALIEVTDKESDAASSAPDKRSCATTMRTECRNEPVGCGTHCVRYGWWWGANTCKEYKYQCEYGNRCDDIPTTVCTSR